MLVHLSLAFSGWETKTVGGCIGGAVVCVFDAGMGMLGGFGNKDVFFVCGGGGMVGMFALGLVWNVDY